MWGVSDHSRGGNLPLSNQLEGYVIHHGISAKVISIYDDLNSRRHIENLRQQVGDSF
jgi:hypothetical protein